MVLTFLESTIRDERRCCGATVLMQKSWNPLGVPRSGTDTGWGDQGEFSRAA